MLEVTRSGTFTVEGNGSARKVQGASAQISHDFHSVWVGDVGLSGLSHEGPDLCCRILHDLKQGCDLLLAHERLVALHVEIDVGNLAARNFVHAFGTAAVGG